jgi:hypothetical protein
MVQRNGQRGASLQIPPHTRVRLESLATLMQVTGATVVERSLEALLRTMLTDDRNIVDLLTCRALQNAGEQGQAANGRSQNVFEARAVKGRPFKYTGSLKTGLEVFFPNSPSLKVSAESIRLIREEVDAHRGSVRMGACLKPLVADSVGEAIYCKHKLTPIHLSFVIPLMESEGSCSTRKEGRNWLVERKRRTIR